MLTSMASDKKWVIKKTGVAIILTAVAWPASPAVGTAAAFAQEADRAEQAEQFQQRLEETRSRLNLTDEQVEQPPRRLDVRPGRARPAKNSAVRIAETFSATAVATNWLMLVPSAFARDSVDDASCVSLP